MKKIVKNKEPNTLTNYRASIPHDKRKNDTIYEDFRDKDQDGCKKNKKGNLRKALLEEQGYICCYCMTIIRCYNSKIEHFKPQSQYREKQITYTNLFISCHGNTRNYEHCDTKKANRLLKKIDLLKNIEKDIKYNNNGKILSDNNEIDTEINDILNLNNKILTKNRMRAYNDLIENMKKKGQSGKWSKNFIRKYLNKYKSTNEHGKYSPYCSMLQFFLEKKLKRCL